VQLHAAQGPEAPQEHLAVQRMAERAACIEHAVGARFDAQAGQPLPAARQRFEPLQRAFGFEAEHLGHRARCELDTQHAGRLEQRSLVRRQALYLSVDHADQALRQCQSAAARAG
jgi:hypothetical protein